MALHIIRDAVRGLRSGRQAMALAFVLLTLAMTAGGAIFSVVDGIALRPLPYEAEEQLVGITAAGSVGGKLYPASPQDYFSWLGKATAFQGLGGARFVSPLQLRDGDDTQAVVTKSVTSNLFDVLGVRLALGRGFGPEHELQGAAPVAIVSHEFWARRLGADPAAVGRPLQFDQGVRMVLGVLPAGVSFPITAGPPTDIYVPYVPTAEDRLADGPRRGSIAIVGRLRVGVSVEQAQADVNRVSAGKVLALHDQVVGPSRSWLLLLLAAVAVVLLVACANVGSLLLARGAGRMRDFATRQALGASRIRLGITLVIEGLILSVTAALTSIVCLVWVVKVVKANVPAGLARVSEIGVNARVAGACMAVAVVCAVASASAPAWFASAGRLLDSLRSDGGAVVGGRTRERALGVFLAADSAFVAFLLVLTTLIVTSFILVETADLGFDRRGLVSFDYQKTLVDVPADERASAAAVLRSELVVRAKAVPGVVDAAVLIGGLPLSGTRYGQDVSIPGRGKLNDEEAPTTPMVTADYFKVMKFRVVRGRGFEASDRMGHEPVAVINEAAAQRYFPGRDAVGQTVVLRSAARIVGVVQNVQADGPEAAPLPELYMLADQQPFFNSAPTAWGQIIVRTNGEPRRLAEQIVAAVKPSLGARPRQIHFVDDYWLGVTAIRRFNASLMGLFGVVALAIGAAGVYGTTSFVVAQQKKTIGLRIALGASGGTILRHVLGTAVQRVAVGTAIGMACALATARALTSFVFALRATEPMVYVSVSILLVAIGAAAGFVPALRAARVDPLSSMRDS